MSKGEKQGFDPSLFKKAVKASIGDFMKVDLFDAIVQAGSQDESLMVCTVDSVDSSIEGLIVRYNLCISDGEINVPEDLSVVTIATTAFTDPYIVKASDLKSKSIAVGKQLYVNDGTLQKFEFFVSSGAGSFGGFIKDVDPNDSEAGLLKALNNLQDDINNLKTLLQTLTTTTILTATPGNPDLFQIALAAGLASYISNTIPRSTDTQLENKNIIHGLSIIP